MAAALQAVIRCTNVVLSKIYDWITFTSRSIGPSTSDLPYQSTHKMNYISNFEIIFRGARLGQVRDTVGARLGQGLGMLAAILMFLYLSLSLTSIPILMPRPCPDQFPHHCPDPACPDLAQTLLFAQTLPRPCLNLA